MENIKNKKILMALMSFSIGGAETHVLELSIELKRKGFELVVISGGGVYESVLKDAGIRHYRAPLYTKNPISMIKSFAMLKRVIKEEKIDIVHAHGRIPAFLCGILHKFMDFTFVTTAHWVFDTGHGLKYLSNWGDKVVAVSKDIKAYLMDNYHTNPMDIFVTINGIDTEKFSPNVDYSSAIEEFGLSNNSRKIVYLSRMDEDRAAAAFRLLEAAEEIYSLHNDIEIIIVGSGNVFDKVKKNADAINDRVGKKLVTLTGGRTDVYKFTAMADIFIGVSRAALEAMSCAKPVIVAGNEGYIGIFDEDKLSIGIETNFCCRGLEKTTAKRLKNDILCLLNCSDEQKKRLSDFARYTVIDHYSVSKMADDNIRMYKAAVDSYKYDAVISGYYGFGNSGDEALLCGTIQNLRELKEDIKICVLSKDPKKTAIEHEVHSINRYNFFGILKTLKSAALFISGGGSLIQDVTSSKSLWYYTELIKLAHRFGVKVMVYANGIGPVIKNINRKRTQKTLNVADVITLREDGSLNELYSLGVNTKNVRVTADPALSINPVDAKEAAKLLEAEGLSSTERYLGICFRRWKNATNSDFIKTISGALSHISKKHGLIPAFIPLKKPEDIKISRDIAQRLDCPYKMILGNYGPRDTMGVIGNMKIILAMRLHALIYAAAINIPTVSISYDPKVENFTNYLGIGNYVSIENLTEKKLIDQIETVIKDYDSIENSLKVQIAELKRKAKDDARIAFELIQDCKAHTP